MCVTDTDTRIDNFDYSRRKPYCNRVSATADYIQVSIACFKYDSKYHPPLLTWDKSRFSKERFLFLNDIV